MKKLSVIRGDTIAGCPYGLKTIHACKDVGDIILTMAPLNNYDDKKLKQRAIITNRTIYHTQKTDERCPFANEIMDKFDKVDCSWGDTAAGEGTGYLPASPLYPRTFIGNGLETGMANKGQDIYDPRMYFEAPERGINVPFGLYSIFSSRSNEMGIIRIAEKYTNKIPNIQDKLALLRDRYFDTLKSIIPNGSFVKLNEAQLEKLLFVIDDWTK